MADKIQIAGVQMNIELGNIGANVERLISRFRESSANGAQLTVFPESALSGYCFDSLEEARAFGLTLDSPFIKQIEAVARELDRYVIFGFLELEDSRLFNSALCVGPAGICGKYRKIHLPHLGVDRFTSHGSELEVFRLGSIDLHLGINICYDCSFPEAARVLMLKGADLIVLPTNWPPTSGLTADLIPNARALENNVYVISVNRIGNERGFSFIGKSKICNPRGADEAFANHSDEAIITAEIDPAWSRRKHLVNIPGLHEVDRVKDRVPSSYAAIVESTKQ